jgi:Pyruvate/2-oxoacid:ferredoxin oxidoreductase gamma subunit
VSPFAERTGLTGERLFEALRAVLQRYFGKRGGSVVEANLTVVREAYDSLIDVTAATGLTAGVTAPAEVRVPEEVLA